MFDIDNNFENWAYKILQPSKEIMSYIDSLDLFLFGEVYQTTNKNGDKLLVCEYSDGQNKGLTVTISQKIDEFYKENPEEDQAANRDDHVYQNG